MNPTRVINKTLQQYCRNLKKFDRAVRVQPTVESVHQLRVNTRKLRNFIWIFRSLYSSQQRNDWDAQLKRMANTVSDLRDLDVYLEFLLDYKKSVQPVVGRKMIDKLARTTKAPRSQMEQNVQRAFQSLHSQQILADISEILVTARRGSKPVKGRELYKISRNAICKKAGRLLAYDAIINMSPEAEELHKMRIEAKHLRYSLESLKDLYPSGFQKFLKPVVSFHKQLGEIHDLDVWMADIDSTVAHNNFTKKELIALSKMEKYMNSRRELVYKKFLDNWKISKHQRLLESMGEYVYAWTSSKL